MLTIDSNYCDFIVLNTNASSSKSTFLVDTQADISIFKFSSLHEQFFINKSNVIHIKGITNDTIDSIGTTNIELFLNDGHISHNFHVVPDSFNISTDGIIGKDFLAKHKCTINFETRTFTVNSDMHACIFKISQGPDEDSVIIPARSEVTRRFRIDADEDCVVDHQEIGSGIFLSRAIVHPKNAFIRVLNTTNNPTRISSRISNFEPLSNFDCYYANATENQSREQKLNELMAGKIPPMVQDQLLPLIHKYNDIFAMPEDTMTVNNFYTQKLRIADYQPVYTKNYRTPYAQKEEIKEQVNRLIKNDLIEPSISNFNSPVILVPKKSTSTTKKWRMCIDYRLVNRKLIADKYPLPRIDDILDGLGRAKFFSVIDLFNGFHQVPLSEESRDITAFSTEQGSFRWKVLPFGLNVSPNSFQRMMCLAFSGLPPDKLFVYMDDVIVIGKSEQDHINNLEEAFDTCRKKNLKVNPDKCQFFRTEVLFLGHKCSSEGIQPDPSKYDTIQNYPTPTDSDAVRRFVALANYYRKFIPDFAKISIPLNALTRKNAVFDWTYKCQSAFDKIKSILANPKTLAYPDFTQEFVLTVDASKLGCGAVLSQNDAPIAFASKSFNKAESNKSTIEQELIAIHWSIRYFKHYLYCRHFIVRSDHRPLVYLFSLKDPTSKLTRLRMELVDFDFTVEHIPGKLNVVADALSRIHISTLAKLQGDAASIYAITTRSMAKKMRKNQLKRSQEQTDNHSSLCKVHIATDQYVSKKVPLILTKPPKAPNPPKDFESLKPLNATNPPKDHELLKPPKAVSPPKDFELLKPPKAASPPKDCENSVMLRNKNICTELTRVSSSINAKLILNELFARLNQEADRQSLHEAKIYRDDKIFDMCSINEFKQMGNEKLKYLTITIVNRPIAVKEPNKQKELISLYHDNAVFGGHIGKKRLYHKLRHNYYWKNMVRDVADHVDKCIKCKLNKPKPATKIPLCITDTPNRPFEKISIDTIGPLPLTVEGNRFAVTVNCNLAKYFIPIPIPNKEAQTVAKGLVENVFLIFGLSKEIMSDLGTEYCNSIFKEVMKLLNIDHTTSTAYHPHTVGGIERSHRSLNEYLRMYLLDNNDQWDTYIKYFAYCYNTTPNTSFECKFSPFEIVFGKAPRTLDIIAEEKTDPVYNMDDYCQELKHKLQISSSLAKNLLVKLKEKNKKFHDVNTNEPTFQLNDKVLAIGNNHKLDSIYDGPYTIIALDEYNVIIKHDKTSKTRKLHKNRIVPML